MLSTPEDGNCLYSSLSYWVTGNMNHLKILRETIVNNMVGKLVACNKFIVNIFSMSAINYRNLSDCVAETNMKRNYSWGTDVE